MLACESSRHHGDVDDGDEDEAAHEVGVRKLGDDAGECHSHHDEEDGVEDVGEDRPEGDAEDSRAQGHVRGGEAGDDDAAGDDGEHARAADLLGDEEGEERGGQGGDRRQHGVVGDGADPDTDLRDCRTDEDSCTDASPEGQEELLCDETEGDAGGVLRSLEGDGEDDQGGAVVEE